MNAKRFCSLACRDAVLTIPVADRFWPKVNKDGPIHPVLGTRCWLWTGASDPKGYGILAIPGRSPAKAHRVAWALTHGPIPAGVSILHRCDIPACTNADEHLFQGSIAENNLDMLRKGRARGPAILTAEDVRIIRAAYATGATQGELSRRFLVSQPNIQAIVTRRTWKHVD